MAYFKARVGSSGGTETPTLLWTNPNPTSNLSTAVSITASKAEYPFIIIQLKRTSAANSAYIIGCIDRNNTSGNGDNGVVSGGYSRLITFTDSGLTFSNLGAGIGSTNVGAAYGIPVKVWGMKSVPYNISI